MHEYRVTRVNGKIPHWRIDAGSISDLALTEEDAMGIIGQMLKDAFEQGQGGDFRILWEGVPKGFKTPDLDLVFSDPSSVSH